MLLTIASLVHGAATGHAQPASPPVATTQPIVEADRGANGLTAPATVMYESILDAARSGRIEELRYAIELNEIKPLIGDGGEGDAVDAIQKFGAAPDTGDASAILKAITGILMSRWISLPLGRDHENNQVFVWPRFAAIDLKTLTQSELAELTALVPPANLARMRTTGVYDFWRIGIGADGTWHFLRK